MAGWVSLFSSDVVDQYAPSPRWQIDTLITMLSIAGSYLQDEGIINSLIMMIQQNQETHSYVVHKLYWAIKEDMTQLALVHVAVWCIGEYGTELMGPPPHDEEGLADKSQIQDSNIIEMLKNVRLCFFVVLLTINFCKKHFCGYLTGSGMDGLDNK